MPFLAEPEPRRGLAAPVAPGIRRIVAPNPGPMTYWGTNTYLIDVSDESSPGIAVLDPGPDSADHVRAVLDQAGAPIAAILLSHHHHDHLGAVPSLRDATGAPVHAWHTEPLGQVQPDVALHDGSRAPGGLVALHTPGHASDHLCFARGDGVLLSADIVMTWSTSVVNPPDGNMGDYVASLRRLGARTDRLLLPGHGPPSTEPQRLVQELLDHRLQREAAILRMLSAVPRTVPELVQALYATVHPRLHAAAERNVSAHLAKLAQEGRVIADGAAWRATPPASGGR